MMYGRYEALRGWRAILAGAVALAFLLGAAEWGRAEGPFRLGPAEVLVVANRQSAQSLGIAAEYLRKRGIAADHLVKLWITPGETCSRKDYDQKVLAPVRSYLKERDPEGRIRCLVTCFGVPLKVAAPELSRAEQTELGALKKQQAALRARLGEMPEKDAAEATAIERQLAELAGKLHRLDKSDQGAALDSELTLALEDHPPLAGWVPNPLFVGFKDRDRSTWPRRVLMVSRLDGPTPEIAKRLIDDALWAEQHGLSGSAYFDARWQPPAPEKVAETAKTMGYGFYDLSIHRAAKRVEASGRMPVVVNDQEALFAPGSAPGAALYCGWYSLAHYVPAFTWARGAIGYHIASSECATLRAGPSQVWCKRMLEEGVAATLGPVAEPYVQAFPVPELFFSLLLDGRYTLAEAYFYSLPFLSWQMVLVGDPLYRPFQP